MKRELFECDVCGSTKEIESPYDKDYYSVELKKNPLINAEAIRTNPYVNRNSEYLYSFHFCEDCLEGLFAPLEKMKKSRDERRAARQAIENEKHLKRIAEYNKK